MHTRSKVLTCRRTITVNDPDQLKSKSLEKYRKRLFIQIEFCATELYICFENRVRAMITNSLLHAVSGKGIGGSFYDLETG